MNNASNILIIEDEPSIADNIVYALGYEGFQTHWVSLAGEGIEQLKLGSFDLLILDVGLPDMNGFEACKQIRQFSDIPIVFVTARDDEIDRVVGFEIGADDYVTKPFSPRELAARVKARLRRVAPATTAPVTSDASGPFEVDDNKKHITYRGDVLELTLYEFGILRHLVLHPGQVFSREQLMQAVWQRPDISLDRSVDTHIKSLRAKLKAVNGDASPIKTHRGLGYSLSLGDA